VSTAGFQRVRDEVSRCPPAFWRLWALVLANRSGAWVYAFLMLFLTTERGLSIGAAGMVMSSIGAGAVCASVMGGQLSDRWGRKPTLLLSMFGSSVTVLGLGIIDAFGWLLLAAFVFGLFADLYRPAVSAAVSDLVAPETQRDAFAHVYWAHNLGFAIAPVTAGFVVNAFGFSPLFAMHALVLSGCGVYAWRFVAESRGPALHVGEPKGGELAVGALRDPTLWLFLAAFAPAPLLMLQTVSVLPMLMQTDGVDAAAYGRIIAINGLLIVLLQPWLIARLSAFRRAYVLTVGALLLGLGYGGHALADGVTGHIVTLVAWTLGEIAIVPLAAGVVAELAPPEQRGRYQGMYGLTWSFAQLASPWIATHALAQIGEQGWGIGCAALGVCSAVLFAVFQARRLSVPSPSGRGLG
jgi:MFS family permease